MGQDSRLLARIRDYCMARIRNYCHGFETIDQDSELFVLATIFMFRVWVGLVNIVGGVSNDL